MPLEDLTGSQTINNMNPAWPLGSDLPDAGDDHLRGIKNAVQNTFPNITGPVTLSDAEINRGSIPVGSVLPFYQAAAPSGWERVTGMTQTFGLRIVASATAGGVGGGTDDPVVNDKVPSHTHGMSFSSGTESADHSHAFSGVSGYMNQNASHNHGISDPGHSHKYGATNNAGGSGVWGTIGVGTQFDTGAAGTGITIASKDTNHTHNFSGSSGGRSVAHSHVVSGDTNANGSAANWTPRYLDMILCRRV